MIKINKRNIIIADDQNLFAEGIKKLLEQKGDIEVVEIVETGKQVFDAITKFHPDALLLDLNMPDKNGFEVLEEIREPFPDLIIAVLSTYESPAFIKKAKKLQVNAYLSKDAAIEELRQVIFHDYDSDFFLGSKLQKKADKRKLTFDNFTDIVEITDREREVLRLIAKGLTSETISEKLFISHSTVKTHRKNLFRKLKVNNVSELMKIAYDIGLA